MSSQRRESSSEHKPMHAGHEAKRQGLVSSRWCRRGRFEHAPTAPALFHVPRRTFEVPGVQRRFQRLTQLGLNANRVSYSSPLPGPRQSTNKDRLCTGPKATRYEALCPSQGQRDVWYASRNRQQDRHPSPNGRRPRSPPSCRRSRLSSHIFVRVRGSYIGVYRRGARHAQEPRAPRGRSHLRHGRAPRLVAGRARGFRAPWHARFPGGAQERLSLTFDPSPTRALSGNEEAGVPRGRPTQERRTFHSFRHTFAKRLESGAQITWLSRHLGHSSLKVTTDIYGHWERAERKLQAAKMEGVFPV